MTELECMTEYSLVPVDSDVSANVLDYSGDIQWSALYINEIQHNSAGVINITIPEEISWDYTGNDEQFDLYVSGYNVDTDYVQSIIDLNFYHPTSEDFTEIFVGGFSLMFPYIIILLFVVFIRKLLKRIFK